MFMKLYTSEDTKLLFASIFTMDTFSLSIMYFKTLSKVNVFFLYKWPDTVIKIPQLKGFEYRVIDPFDCSRFINIHLYIHGRTYITRERTMALVLDNDRYRVETCAAMVNERSETYFTTNNKTHTYILVTSSCLRV